MKARRVSMDPELREPTIAESRKLKADWAALGGLRQSRARSTFDPIGWLLGKRLADYVVYDRPRWFDHGTCWTKDGKPYCVVGQPYGLSSDDLRQLELLVDAGFDVSVSTRPAWHYPGSVLQVEVYLYREAHT